MRKLFDLFLDFAPRSCLLELKMVNTVVVMLPALTAVNVSRANLVEDVSIAVTQSNIAVSLASLK